VAVTERGTRRRLGLFGGSFDPPHVGHLHAARAALEALELERVLFLPAARPPHKPGRVLAPGARRVEMLELLLAGERDLGIDSRELSREGPSYTIDTVRELLAEEGGAERVELYLIIGTDNLSGLVEWCEVEALVELVEPVVVFREGDPRALFAALEGELSGRAIRRLEGGLLHLPPVRAASTELRVALAAGRDPGEALPPAILEYVRRHGLYAREA